MKNLQLVLRNIKAYPILKYAVCTYGLLCITMISLTIWQYYSVRTLVEDNIVANKHFIETLTIVNDDTNQSYHVATNDIIKSIDDKQKYEYKQFLEKYFEHQSYYLNFWLSMLAIVIGIFAIIIPICFVKFSDDKRKELDRIIRDCRKQKEQTTVNIAEMQKQLEQVERLAKEVKANSMLTWVSADIYLKNYDKALNTINSSIEIMKTIQNLTLRAQVYSEQKDYINALKDLKECLKFGKTANMLYNLECCYASMGEYEKAKEYALESIDKDKKIIGNYYNLTEIYIMLGDIYEALEALKEFICRENDPYIFEDDKEKWITKIKSLQQNEATLLLLKTINEKLTIKPRQ